MNISFENGSIAAYGKLFEETQYDVSNYTLSACFNGKGGVGYYLLADGSAFVLDEKISINFFAGWYKKQNTKFLFPPARNLKQQRKKQQKRL